MSKLRQSVLEFIRTIGNHSGCHQLPERSFFYKGKQFPVCARCTGVTIGQIIAVIVAVFIRVPVNVSLGLLGLMGIDWGLQELHIKESSNRRRLLTGIGGGFGIFSLYIMIFRHIFTRKKATT
ncbi:DUF2085 domain-containing protein [Ohessyouella blattaphilus]|uniref:DUF2085 domain-containing protein n=1 Tax=Ohessyouella blattaphilus TaxID=2949333 RepID=A0ABT1EK13_9FIRM|nr:DUF2085 domain-containing protein [Ohessyouella blattaphilus]MCP1111030.1 DUF2085 domain-containing protein [Ohessyouella blattaphilus]MCR8564424.1 DUF2085 domain-containing protein [Ohessyouella blattaphilus]